MITVRCPRHECQRVHPAPSTRSARQYLDFSKNAAKSELGCQELPLQGQGARMVGTGVSHSGEEMGNAGDPCQKGFRERAGD
ncbi:hypothetical protein HMPREF9004_1798 [Schaalia cardiffensis F0333]|uniref:Uncharacterized protein n=1 Tax=Schaalia cardiffensis F0333 TaxID=888050 RepID=N6X8K9_9ACTO|nr:hypothetical protein HMPREF9004_1798 [Schaalia cardiffensis F0333]